MSKERKLELSVEDIQEVALFDIRMWTHAFLTQDIKDYSKCFDAVNPAGGFKSGEYLVYEARREELRARVRFAHSIGLLSDAKCRELLDIVLVNDKQLLNDIFGGVADAKE